MLGLLPSVVDHTHTGFSSNITWAAEENSRDSAFGERFPRTALCSYTSQQPSPPGFDGWHQHRGVKGYYYTLHWINGDVGAYLLPAFFSFCFSLPSFQQYFFSDHKKQDDRHASVQSVDFTSIFKMCYSLRGFLCVAFVVEVDVEHESMVDNDQLVWGCVIWQYAFPPHH